MIGIIGAMKEEVDEIVKLMEIENEYDECHYHFYQGCLGKCKVAVVQGGIGKVNATISTTLLLKKFNIDHVINIGSAGGIVQNENVGDIVISSSVVHNDVDVTAFGRAYGEIPDMPLFFEADEELEKHAKDYLESCELPYHVGLIASGDQFVHTQEQVDHILNHFPNALCAEMEAASIAQVCYVFNIPFIITRSLSDIFNKGENSMQFDEYLKIAAARSARMCYELVQKI